MNAGGPLFATTTSSMEFFGPLLLAHRHEHAVIAHFNDQGRMVALNEAQGSKDRIILPLRQIIRDALTYDACAVMLAHNHPSGDPTPSKVDIETTRALSDLLRPLSIRLHDHLILTSSGQTTSFRELGWL